MILIPGTLSAQALDAKQESSRGDTNEVELEWTAPPECPSRAQVLSRIEHPSGPTLPLRASATVTVVAQGYLLDLRTYQDGRNGRRQIEGATCESLAEATAVLLSVSLSAHGETAETDPEHVSGESAALEPKPQPRLVSQRTEARRRFVAFGGMLVSSGVGPRLGSGPTLGVAIDSGRNALNVSTLAILPTESRESSGRGARFSSLGLRATACHFWGQSLQLGGCGAALFGAFHAVGLGVDEGFNPWGLRVSSELQLPLRWSTKTATLSLAGHVGMNLLRPSFVFDPYGTYFRPPLVYGGAGLTSGWKF